MRSRKVAVVTGAVVMLAASAATSAQLDKSAVESGEAVYLRYCALCHGVGVGPGPLADAMQKVPPDLTGIAARNGGVFPEEKVAQTIRDGGIGGHGTMRLLSWSEYFKQDMSAERADQMITELTAYLKSRQTR